MDLLSLLPVCHFPPRDIHCYYLLTVVECISLPHASFLSPRRIPTSRVTSPVTHFTLQIHHLPSQCGLLSIPCLHLHPVSAQTRGGAPLAPSLHPTDWQLLSISFQDHSCSSLPSPLPSLLDGGKASLLSFCSTPILSSQEVTWVVTPAKGGTQPLCFFSERPKYSYSICNHFSHSVAGSDYKDHPIINNKQKDANQLP